MSVQPALRYPPKPRPGDRVAVLSPSAAAPAQFPDVFELGLRRLRESFGLVPVEYPTTRRIDASPRDRAADINAAFGDPDIRAVFASIGGDDQIKVLRHLDADVLAGHPKPFFGYSDNTNLLNYLWNLGIVGYHGGSVMVQLGRGRRMHPVTETSMRTALFTSDVVTIPEVAHYTDEELDWADPAAVTTEPVLQPASPWAWHGAPARVTGPTWGGNLEILDWNLRVGTHIRPVADYAGAIFFFETSEELPAAGYVYRVLMAMGERGLLQQFAAVVAARPKAWSLDDRTTGEAKAKYTQDQAAAVLQAIAEYNPAVPVVLGLDFGHTDPQVVIPNGGTMTVDPVARTVSVAY